jgi:transposase
MAKSYRPVLRDQPFLLPPDMREWLPAGHPVWLVIAAVEGHLDTSAFHARRRTGGAGAAGYDPDMLVTLLIWAYAQGVTSSRRIEAACWTDVAFRVICAGDVPDHVTIARFRSGFPGAVEELFTGVLVLCARLGTGQLGTVALDGMKIAASASKAANRTEETLRKLAAGRVAAHAAADAADDAAEARRPGRVPPPGGPPRDERIAAALAEITAERQAAEAARDAQAREYLARQQGGMAGAPPLSAAVAAAQARLDRARADRAAQIAELERRAAGPAAPGRRRDRPAAGVEDYCLVRAAREALARAEAKVAAAEEKAAAGQGPGPVRNITDPDSRLMPTRNGFIQGYNAQNAGSEDGLIIATELTQDTTGMHWLEPMLRQAGDAATLITRHQPPPAGATPGTPDGDGTPEGDGSGIGLMLADAGYLSRDNLTTPGPDRLIATGKHRDLERTARHAAAPGSSGDSQDDDPIAAMAARLATPEGITAYRQRSHIAETPHGNIKHNKRFRQLTIRGLPKASAEWRFAATARNFFKAISTGHLTPDALTALAS